MKAHILGTLKLLHESRTHVRAHLCVRVYFHYDAQTCVRAVCLNEIAAAYSPESSEKIYLLGAVGGVAHFAR